jgi:hypothetical protein
VYKCTQRIQRAAFRLLLAGLVLASLALRAEPHSAIGQAEVPDPRSLNVVLSDLPGGFAADQVQTDFSNLPGGGLRSIAAYRRPGDGVNPSFVRTTVHSLPDGDSAQIWYDKWPKLLTSQGFVPAPAPTVGVDSLGFSSDDVMDGQPVVYQTVVYRLDTLVVVVTVVGPRGSTTLDVPAALARVTYARGAATLGLTSTVARPAATGIVPAASVAAPAAAPASITQVLGTPPGPPGLLLSGVLSDAPDIGAGLQLTGFSGLVALDQTGTLFVTVTDRGPNLEVRSGKHGNGKRTTFPMPTYSPSIVKLRLTDDRLEVVERMPIKLPLGYTDPLTGNDGVSGLFISDNDEAPYASNGEDRLPTDPYGVDPEGLALDPRDGTFWVCEEYGPSILHIAADGRILYRLVPKGIKLDAPGEDMRGVLPAALMKHKDNRGFEGISISPDGSTLFVMLQSPLAAPDEDTAESSRNIRMLTLDVSNTNKPTVNGMYAYIAESGGKYGVSQDDVRIGDIAAVSTSKLLVIERDNQSGGRHKKVYLVDLSSASNVLQTRISRNRSLEELDTADLKGAGIKPVSKSMVADLARYGYDPEKVEGLAIIDEKTLAVVNDNDFGLGGYDDQGNSISNGIETRLSLVRLDRSIK